MRLFNILRFVAVPPSVPTSLPHGLNWDSHSVIPDFLAPGAGAGSFTLTATATDVTVVNTSGVAASLDVLAASLHTILRVFGSTAILALTPQPFVLNPAQGVISSGEGNTVMVDPIFGNDATGIRQGAPFATVGAGLAAALPGDVVLVHPGIYDLAAGITIPTNVALVSQAPGTVTLRMLNVVGATTLVTMGVDSYLGGISLSLTSALHVDLIGIDFPGLTAATAHVRACNINVDNSGAGVGASTVIGVRSNGTGVPTVLFDTLLEVLIAVASTGAGAARGVLVAGANVLHLQGSHVSTTGAGGGTFIGVETNHANARCVLNGSTIAGASADILQTLGALQIEGATSLTHSNAGGLGFDTLFNPTLMTFGDPGPLTNGTRYFYPGTATTSPTPVFVRLANATIAKGLSLRATTPPGGILTVVVTVQKNGVDTLLTATLTGAQTAVVVDTISVSFAAGDDLSIKVVDSGATADMICVVELY